jgi:hypothetical protein
VKFCRKKRKENHCMGSQVPSDGILITPLVHPSLINSDCVGGGKGQDLCCAAVLSLN